MKAKNLILIIISAILIILGIIFPFLMNKENLSLIVNLPAFLIVYSVIACYSYLSKNYNKIERENIKNTFDNDIFYNGSIWGAILGAFIGIIELLININDYSAVGPGLSLFFISIFYGLFSGQVSKAIKSHRELKNEKSQFLIIFDVYFIYLCVLFIIGLGMYWSRLDFEKVFHIEDLIIFICIYMGLMIFSRRYIVINNCILKSYNDSELQLVKPFLNDSIISAIHTSIIVAVIRFMIYIVTTPLLDPFPMIAAIVLFPLLYGLIVSIVFIMPLKFRIKEETES